MQYKSDTFLILMIIMKFLNQVCASLQPARAWFLEIDPVHEHLYVCLHVRVCVCVSAPEAINN